MFDDNFNFLYLSNANTFTLSLNLSNISDNQIIKDHFLIYVDKFVNSALSPINSIL
jgi:hypothetical protein